MLRTVFLKSLRDHRRALAWWGIALAAFAVYISAFWPTIRENAAQFSRVLEELPEGLRALIGGTGDLVTAEGYLHQQVFQLTGPVLFVIFAIRLGARATAGEEAAGTLDLLLSTPVPRWRVLVEKLLDMVAETALAGAVLWAGLAVSAPLFGIEVATGRVAEAVASTVFLGLVFGTLALAVGSATGSRGLAIGAAGAVAFATYLINALSALVPSLEKLALLSPFHYYGAAVPIRSGLDPGHVAVLAGLVVGFSLTALFAFERRDLSV